MHLIRFRSPSVRVRMALAIIAGVALLAAACGGDDEAEPAPDEPVADGTPIPTATPYASVPEPTIVASPTTQAATTTTTATTDDGDVEYIVEPGDNLFAIAERFDTTVDAIMERNDIDDAALIFVGQVLIVPQGYTPPADDTADTGDAASEDDESESTTTTDDSGTETYVVQAGDTAYGIALTFDVTLEELAAANGTTVEELGNLFEGDELVIP